MLLHLLRRLRERRDLDIQLVLLRGGPLVETYVEVCPTRVIDPSPLPGQKPSPLPMGLRKAVVRLPMRDLLIRLRNRGRRMKQRMRLKRVRQLLTLEGVDLVYINAIGSTAVLSERIPKELPMIVHVHELDIGMKYGLERSTYIDMFARDIAYIAASPATERMLYERFGFPRERISTVHAAIEDVDADSLRRKAQDVRADLGIPPDALIVGMAGTVDWRKGRDLFLQIARTVLETTDRDVHFLWVGGGWDYERFMHVWNADRSFPAELRDRVHFTGEQTDALPFIAAMDIFALTSREDPFPLVSLEAALLHKPIVCFAESGGAAEWVSDGAGCVIDHMNTDAFADAVLRLIDDSRQRQAYGERAREIVRGRYLIDSAARKILTVIEETMRKKA